MIADLIDMISEWFYPAFIAFAIFVCIAYNVIDSITDHN